MYEKECLEIARLAYSDIMKALYEISCKHDITVQIPIYIIVNKNEERYCANKEDFDDFERILKKEPRS